MKTHKFLFSLLISTLVLFSCTSHNGNKAMYMPSISGKPGDVLIIIEKDIWESENGATLRTSLASEYPFLNQREPLFTLYSAPPKTFRGAFLVHRNIIIVNVSAELDSARVTYQEDVWAAPQAVITISAPSQEAIEEVFLKNESRIISTLEQAERNRIIHISKKYEELKLRATVSEIFGGSPHFPKGYSLKMQTNDFVWISHETTYVNQGIFIYKYPYTEHSNLSLEEIIAKRNTTLRLNVPGMREGSYMTTGTYITPGLKWIKYQDRNFAEVRGIWELEKDYMGGPFISHTFMDKAQQNIIVIEGFVYAPKFEKRNYLRHVESIIYSFKWDKE